MSGPRPFSNLRDFGCFVAILVSCVSGAVHAPAWIAVPASAVALLWISNRGQHRDLVDYASRLSPAHVLTLSIGAHLLNNLLFCSLAYVFGMAAGWLWEVPTL